MLRLSITDAPSTSAHWLGSLGWRHHSLAGREPRRARCLSGESPAAPGLTTSLLPPSSRCPSASAASASAASPMAASMLPEAARLTMKGCCCCCCCCSAGCSWCRWAAGVVKLSATPQPAATPSKPSEAVPDCVRTVVVAAAAPLPAPPPAVAAPGAAAAGASTTLTISTKSASSPAFSSSSDVLKSS